jgi:hypothetical protein
LIILKAAVEGVLDEVVLRALASKLGMKVNPVYGKKGKQDLRSKIPNYKRAAQFEPWIILVDLNHDAQCAPELCRNWIVETTPHLCFRVAVRAIESWLLADRENIAKYLSIPQTIVPDDPEVSMDPKETIISLARQSRRARIRVDMVPSPRGGRKVGPAYTSSLIEFVNHPEVGWRPLVAAERSDSLQRCFNALRSFKGSQ